MDKPLPAFRQLQIFIAEQTARKPHSTSKPNTKKAKRSTRRIARPVRADEINTTRLKSTDGDQASRMNKRKP